MYQDGPVMSLEFSHIIDEVGKFGIFVLLKFEKDQSICELILLTDITGYSPRRQHLPVNIYLIKYIIIACRSTASVCW